MTTDCSLKMKIPSSNLGRTCCVQKLLYTCSPPCSAKRRASDKDLPVHHMIKNLFSPPRIQIENERNEYDGIFDRISLPQASVWAGWATISDAVLYAYPDWNNSTIALLGNWGEICYLVAVVPLTWLIQAQGMQRWHSQTMLTRFCPIHLYFLEISRVQNLNISRLFTQKFLDAVMYNFQRIRDDISISTYLPCLVIVVCE